jgi:diguanylate cyclase (GGDEF)-like protein
MTNVGRAYCAQMGSRTLNGSKHAAVTTAPRAQYLSCDAADEITPNAVGSAPPRWVEAFPDTTKGSRTLAGTEQKLAAALLRIDALQRRDALLKQQVARLAKAIRKTRRFAYHDELTGLPNRYLMVDRFNQAVARAARQDKHVALLFLDLDGFKSINDTLGHPAGDGLLQRVATRLAACIRTSDTACRYGGDEFVVLLPDLDGRESAVAAAKKVRTHLELPYVVDGTAIKITMSVGMAVYPVDGSRCSDLLRVSDRAMYVNKARGPAESSVLKQIAARR